MTNVVIGLGSNLNNPAYQVRRAIECIAKTPAFTLLQSSKLYLSKPLGGLDQPDFVNAVVIVKTDLLPHDVLLQLQNIEHECGRQRKERWASRIIDLDIILYGEMVLNDERLTIPHPGLLDREFWIYPLADIAPQLQLPDGQSILSLRKRCPLRELVLLE